MVATRRGLYRRTLDDVSGLVGLTGAVAPRRRRYALAIAAAGFPLLTYVLTGLRGRLDLADEVLVYLLLVVAVSVVGGLLPAVVAAVAASLLLNWFFTPPIHTFTIDRPDNLLALLLFIVVAVTVSSVVHLAARRAEVAARSRDQSTALLALADLVLSGQDNPQSILDYLHQSFDVGLQLRERRDNEWVTLATSGIECDGPERQIPIRSDLRLIVRGPLRRDRDRVVEAAAGQCAAALDRERLRDRAAQTEALAAGNRMRTALLAAVSHDLRTPLASLKAGVSSLRQSEVAWSPADEEALLETIDEATDRLTYLISGLLDMSRITTGAVQASLRPVVVEEVIPGALAGLPGERLVRVGLTEDLPLVLTDPMLLERSLANLLSNALRFSPPGCPPEVVACSMGDRVRISVVDHGPGVAAPDRDRIFQPFQRLGDQHAGSGVGLGLAVARGFVEAVGGSLEAEETPGGGLTMTVSLPLAGDAVTARPVGSR